ncbi:uncharacterized protein LOC110454184 [Mizuhopecten yessoensis]|uniref:uncharacterized protein LOC110454184 n=1 Tax=Mizuhopecten yessoensis TaxID=6573 RepID=UPI000B458AD9|nr:uncharacterized protein LOC110454184 [Mizuhopecten yessoensis]
MQGRLRPHVQDHPGKPGPHETGLHVVCGENLKYTFGSCNQGDDVNINDLVTLPNVKELVKELKKLQTVIVSLDHRVEILESSMHIEEVENHPPAVGRLDAEIVRQKRQSSDMTRANRMDTETVQLKRMDTEAMRVKRIDQETVRGNRKNKETVRGSRMDMETMRYDNEAMVPESFHSERHSEKVYRKNGPQSSGLRNPIKNDVSPQGSPTKGTYKRKRVL